MPPLGRGAIGFAPFGLDFTNYSSSATATLGSAALSPDTLAAFALDYEAVGPMAREVARLNFEGRLQAVAEQAGQPTPPLSFGNWEAAVTYGGGRRGGPTPAADPALPPPPPMGRALIGQLGPDQFLVTGAFCHIRFRPAGANAGKTWQYLRVEEGQYRRRRVPPASASGTATRPTTG